MTFADFIQKLTLEQVDYWWNSVAPEQINQKVEASNWKYSLIKNGKHYPFKWVVEELATFYQLEFTKNDFGSSLANRNTFCEAFGFDIKEDLVYDSTELSDFRKFYKKIPAIYLEVFQSFNDYLSQLVITNEIDPYKIRMALRNSNSEAMVVVGMRATHSFSIQGNKIIMTFILKDDVLHEIPDSRIISREQFTGKDTDKWLVGFEIESWEDIPLSVLESNSDCFIQEYETVKNTKRATWNAEANSSNSTFKYIVFKALNINRFMDENASVKVLDFKTIVRALQAYIQNSSSVIKGFRYSKFQKGFAWFWDNEKIIGDYNAHYELEFRQNKISVDIHFEDDGFKKFQDELEKITLPEKVKWLDRRHKDGRKEITYFEMYDLDTPDLVIKLAGALEYLEQNMGHIIRDIKQKIITTQSTGSMNTIPLNQILYGPPGTGKTYNTINTAISIANPEFDLHQNRKILKAEYDRMVETGQIVFTTFHQSMSYEDFIEGIKPQTKNEKVTYAVEDGMFKQIVKSAMAEYLELPETSGNEESFDAVYSNYINYIKPLAGKREGTFTTKTGVEMMLVDVNENSLLVKYLWSNKKKEGEGQVTFSVTKEKLKKVLQEGIDPNRVKNLRTELHPLVGHIHCELFAVYKSFYDFVITNKGEVDTVHFDYSDQNYKDVKELFDALDRDTLKNKIAKPYILIIDEINRGNVSQIFGELITLIEESKRLGKEEGIEVILPYSKDKFGVPSNLYIIGTMNTADRSIEALDTALRRRFSFKEMLPEPELLSPSAMYCKLLWDYKGVGWKDSEFVAKEDELFRLLGVSQKLEEEREAIWEQMKKDNKLKIARDDYFENFDYSGVNLKDLLETINKRIEVLLDRDHTIGHSYFIGVNSVEELKSVFQNNIIPLLQEYFFGDYEKIALILGEGFVECLEASETNVNFAKWNGRSVQAPEIMRSFHLRNNIVSIESAVRLLLNE